MARGNRFQAFWPNSLRDAELQNLSEANAEIIQSCVGRPHWLVEMATGGPAIDGDDPRVPTNAQGLRGHDHRGPPYGPAFRHTICAWGGALSSGGGWTRYRQMTLGGGNRFLFKSEPFVVFPDSIEDTPYSRIFVDVRAKAASGTQDVVVKIRINDESWRSEAIAVTTSDEVFQLAEYLTPRSGENRVEIEISGATTDDVYIVGVSCSQIVKLSH